MSVTGLIRHDREVQVLDEPTLRAVFRPRTQSSVEHWELQRLKVSFFGFFRQWEPFGVAVSKSEAIDMLNALAHGAVIYPRRSQ